MKSILLFFFVGCLVVQSAPIFGQNRNRDVVRIFYGEPYTVVENQIYDGSRRHAIYSYIIANMTTPGFDAFQFLPADDQAELRRMIPNKDASKEVVLEYVMTKMADNNRRETALMTMWKNKKDGLQRIVTLGK